MSIADDLLLAAGFSLDQVYIANTQSGILRTKLQAFCEQASPVFDDGNAKDRPIGNWLVPMYALAATISNLTSPAPPYQAYDVAWYLYQICYQAFYYASSDAQRNALLAAWNDNFGTP